MQTLKQEAIDEGEIDTEVVRNDNPFSQDSFDLKSLFFK